MTNTHRYRYALLANNRDRAFTDTPGNRAAYGRARRGSLQCSFILRTRWKKSSGRNAFGGDLHLLFKWPHKGRPGHKLSHSRN